MVNLPFNLIEVILFFIKKRTGVECRSMFLAADCCLRFMIVRVGVVFVDVVVCFVDVSGLVVFRVGLIHYVLLLVTFSGIHLFHILSILVINYFSYTQWLLLLYLLLLPLLFTE